MLKIWTNQAIFGEKSWKFREKRSNSCKREWDDKKNNVFKIKQNTILSYLHTLTSYSCIWVVGITADIRASRAVSEVSLSASALNLIQVHCASTRASTKVLARKSYCICWSKHIVSCAISKGKIGSQHKAEFGKYEGFACKYKYTF